MERLTTELEKTQGDLASAQKRIALWRERAERAESESAERDKRITTSAEVRVVEISEEIAKHTPGVSRYISSEDQMHVEVYEGDAKKMLPNTTSRWGSRLYVA